jgi:hypothetical protein
MLTVDIPGWRSLQLEVLLLDVDGTLTLDGELLAGVEADLKAWLAFWTDSTYRRTNSGVLFRLMLDP